jgi:hypothetical protein
LIDNSPTSIFSDFYDCTISSSAISGLPNVKALLNSTCLQASTQCHDLLNPQTFNLEEQNLVSTYTYTLQVYFRCLFRAHNRKRIFWRRRCMSASSEKDDFPIFRNSDLARAEPNLPVHCGNTRTLQIHVGCFVLLKAAKPFCTSMLHARSRARTTSFFKPPTRERNS